ncbi:hypothetical protein BJF93_11570 [Xaviernesmea oryzae]|uniref:Glycosyl transferase family 2 n=2 Tax=Xaviernesmea oryzae TaxID=464029 RepID=A0A1Q9AVM2_9HYPH|nr:hypothetical protein BJF93_11570 [Xaviernesmea oryzae]
MSDPTLRRFNLAPPRALRADDIPLVFLCHNDRAFLPSFLAHYRGLGVTRFICVDDASTDESQAYLEAEPDVDLWISDLRYGAANRGRLWRESLFEIYGRHRWYVNVDADEYLVYQSCAERPLSRLIDRLQALGITRLSAPMIDFYPAGPVGDFIFSGDSRVMPWEVATHYDVAGYDLSRSSISLQVRGGPRRRIFGADVQLIKFPLLYWDDACSLGTSIHHPIPFQQNFAPIAGVLLHFKFFAGVSARFERISSNGQHFGGAEHYKLMLGHMEDLNRLDFTDSVSHRFADPDSMVEEGFMRSLWPVL